MARFDMPSATSPRTSRSRSVNREIGPPVGAVRRGARRSWVDHRLSVHDPSQRINDGHNVEQALLEEVAHSLGWSATGLHYRTADVQAQILGRKVVHYMAKNYFQPLDCPDPRGAAACGPSRHVSARRPLASGTRSRTTRSVARRATVQVRLEADKVRQVPTVGEVVAALDRLYDPARAEAWDAVGLVCGDPDAEVGRVLFAVDPVEVVVSEAIEWGADLLVTHHPLFLRAVHGVAATTPKGRLVHGLVSSGVALHVMHTNADSADPGVSDAFAAVLDLGELRPIDPQPAESVDKLVVFVPEPDAERLIDALAAAGAGDIGAYERCAWTTAGTGTFRPGPGADPTIGAVGSIERVAETRVEMVLARALRPAVLEALRAVHPYEEPAYDVYELAQRPGSTGIGRIGTLEEAEPFTAFVQRVARALPATASGVRGAGEPDAAVRTVAVCGGAGDSLLAAVRIAGVDAYVTADLRHHPALESREHGSPALVDVSHWASEWPWLGEAARRLDDELARAGTTVETRASAIPTDPWTVQAASDSTSAPEEASQL
jgi:dinuclear metal center YbgI/SA1388 family protein